MNLQDQMDLQQQFEAAVARVDNLLGDQAAAHMTELYGLYKQATEGDHDAKYEDVGDDTPDNPSGPGDISQAQWDSWSKFKGLSQDDARRQYVEKVNAVAGPVGEQPTAITGNGQPATGSQINPEAAAGSSAGGLRGDITAGAPYGGEDQLKEQQ